MAEIQTSTLHTTEIGDTGEPVVFLHGLFGRGKNFTRIAKDLVPGYRSLLVDLPNHGESDWTDTVDYRQMADSVAETLRGGFAAQGPVAVVGHSLGGKVAMVLALRHPELVSRLVVVDIAPTRAGGAEGEFAHLLDSLAAVDLSTVRRRQDAEDALRGPIPWDTTRLFLLQNLRGGADGYSWEPNLELLRRSLDAIGGFPDTGAAVYEGPVLWVAGGRSDYVRDEYVPIMRELFPRTHRVTIREAGHWVHSQAPEKFTAVLRGFLEHG
ncbi:alpha/beta fold hydrolase [Citricoccus sp. SGAir0253]|uniref:alpha/beta fold hydrolase n=1 Tax=Citricoccus sp. SGAir0253 TaxID=2567881 RepID=UPI0010CCD5BE|nr:alpha/beta fold hydrolase [Citricoccus sp. SGAir0253]QCU77666.1 alpha/beta fold hydrolase [Citricoccus sp. SGAir0253]